MSFLLTPVALICPIFSQALTAPEAELESNCQSALHQEQAVCRIHKQSNGVTDISVGVHNVGIYPIHYVSSEQPYLIFANRTQTFGDVERVQMWVGPTDGSAKTSSVTELDIQTDGLALSKIDLEQTADQDRDVLWLSFQHKDQTCHLVQVQLSKS